MAALDWITVQGFKSIKSIKRLALGPINVLIGSNGIGKSNFLDAFHFLNAIRTGELRKYVAQAGGAEKVLHLGSKETQHLYLHISFNEEEKQYSLELSPDDADNLVPTREKVYFGEKEQYPNKPYDRKISSFKSEAGNSNPDKLDDLASYVYKNLQSWQVYHFHDTSVTSKMKKAANVNDNRRLRRDGSNLAAFLYYLRKKRSDSYNLIQKTVRLAAPFFGKFSLEPLTLHPDQILLEWLHEGTDTYFNASSLSDGSLRFIALATLLLQPSELRPSIILLDEPELGLHPYAIALLASLIRQASVETQIVLATQSSLFLDHFCPDEVLVAERVQGATEFRRLDGNELEDWLEDYSLGQLWEKNLLGGRPIRENAPQAT